MPLCPITVSRTLFHHCPVGHYAPSLHLDMVAKTTHTVLLESADESEFLNRRLQRKRKDKGDVLYCYKVRRVWAEPLRTLAINPSIDAQKETLSYLFTQRRPIELPRFLPRLASLESTQSAHQDA